jgi:hypothetical protein
VIKKNRLTHNHSYDFFPGSSINSRCHLDLHEPCLFGKALSRIFHWIIHLHARFRTKCILITGRRHTAALTCPCPRRYSAPHALTIYFSSHCG